MKNENYYVQEEDLVRQLQEWKESASNIEDRIVSDGMAQNIMLIATHLLRHKRFVRYPQQDKDDMRQEAIIKCFKNLKNIDTSKGSIFSYLTRVCWSAYMDYLRGYYKDLNHKKQILADAIGEVANERGFENVKYLTQLMGQLNSTISGFTNEGECEIE